MHLYQTEYAEWEMEYQYTVDCYSTYSVHIRSNNFSGSENFCISGDTIHHLIRSLAVLEEKLAGQLTLCDCESDSFISLEFVSHNILSLYGQIGGSHEDNYLHFKTHVDQTVLPLLKNVLSDAFL